MTLKALILPGTGTSIGWAGPREEGTSIDRVSVAFSVDPGEKAY